MPVRFLDEQVDETLTAQPPAQGRVHFLDEEVVAPVVETQEVAPEEPGLVRRALQSVTGADRMTPEVAQALPIGMLPELNKFDMKSIMADITKVVSSDEEFVDILKVNYPDLPVETDEKGNIFVTSLESGQRHIVNPPGFGIGDIKKFLTNVAMFSPAGRVPGVAARMLASAGIQTGVEAAQLAAGGEFDAEEVGLAGAIEGVIPGAGKVIRGAKGLISKTPSALEETVKQAERAGITPMTSDVFEPTTRPGRLAQTITEQVPFVGTGVQRAAQKEQVQQSVNQFLDDQGVSGFEDVSPKIIDNLLRKDRAFINRNTQSKMQVINKLSTNELVPLTKTNKFIDDTIGKLNERGTESSLKLADELTKYKDDLQERPLNILEDVRKEFGDKLKDPNLAVIAGEAEKINKKVYRQLVDDMGDFIKRTGDEKDFVKWKVANANLSKNIDEKKKLSALSTVLNKGDVQPDAVKRLLFSQDNTVLEQLNKRLSPKGKQNARLAIMQKVAQDAGGVENISVMRFKNALKKQDKQIRKFFSKEDQDVIEGLIKGIELTKRAQTAGALPETGAQIVPIAAYATLREVLGGPVATGVGLAGIGKTAQIIESKPVRNLLLRLNRVPKGKEDEILRKLTPLLQGIRQESQQESEQ